MIYEIIRWLLIVELGQLIANPLTAAVFRFLPGKGAAFSRIIALLLTGYSFWLLNQLGLIGNNLGGLLISLLPLLLLSGYFLKKNFYDLNKWNRENSRYLFICELIFLTGFALTVVFRIADPAVAGTEKPMEMMFINSILKSDAFPPHDGWLSGFSISYYYFGYLFSAVLIRLSAVPSSVGFNLMLATIFGMAAAAAFSIVNDLVQSDKRFGGIKIRISALLAPVMMLLIGNLEGLLELLHVRGLFWNADGSSTFWQWLGIKELDKAPLSPFGWDPTGRPGIWWWRASRVLSDTGLDGSSKEIIDEFPYFSFHLGDLHPHVIGIPFVLLVLAAALNFYFQKQLWTSGPLAVAADEFWLSRLLRFIQSGDFWFAALSAGGLIFINTWDFPIYFGIMCLAAALPGSSAEDGLRNLINRLMIYGIPLGIACLGMYGLFMHGLSSQAGGVIPSGAFVTRPIHFLIMFGCFLLPVIFWAWNTGRKAPSERIRTAFKASFGLFGILLAASTGLTLVLINASHAQIDSTHFDSIGSRAASLIKMAADAYAGIQGSAAAANPYAALLLRRLGNLPLMFVLFGLAGLGLSIISNLNAGKFTETQPESSSIAEGDISDRFVGILLLFAMLLAIFPEFFYLRDFFGTRMNTIFKFYYQVWILLSIVTACAINRLHAQLKGFARQSVLSLSVVLFIFCLIYPFFGISGKLENTFRKLTVSSETATLDGSRFLQQSNPNSWAGIEWLRNADYGVIAEKVGGSYTAENAASTFSGRPTVLGPINHESQWRGGYTEIGTREADVRKIFESASWAETEKVLLQYKVRYVFISSTERNAYAVQERKFEANSRLVFESGDCRIYQIY